MQFAAIAGVDFRSMAGKYIDSAWLASRLDRGYQIGLANATKLSQGRISRAVSGEQRLPAKHAQAVADFLGVKVDDIPIVVDTKRAARGTGGHLQTAEVGGKSFPVTTPRSDRGTQEDAQMVDELRQLHGFVDMLEPGERRKVLVAMRKAIGLQTPHAPPQPAARGAVLRGRKG